jgi:hypothetical protein
LPSVFELVVLVAGTVSIVLIVDYWIVKWYFEPILKANPVHTLFAGLLLESFAFILIGIHFLEERVEKTGGFWGPAMTPDMVYIPPLEVIHKARRKLGITLIGAGTVLFILGMFILPNYKL